MGLYVAQDIIENDQAVTGADNGSGKTPTGLFRKIVNDIRENSEHLPSLPTVCVRVRKGLANPNTQVAELEKMIERDPALSAFLLRTASSPIYHNQQSNPSLRTVIPLLGFSTINNLTMLHSVKSLFINHDRQLKPLCQFTWRQLALKAALASLFAQKLHFRTSDQAMLAAIYTELGSLAILSALRSAGQVPDLPSYQLLCRSYAVSLGSLILRKWQCEPEYMAALKQCGNWGYAGSSKLELIDVINLAHYHAATMLPTGLKLPALTDLVAYQKLPASLQATDQRGQLALVMAERSVIARLANTFL
ncbi:HDOD domain-containing protein [Halioxenophilus sp. WMMB6]|uniref:HDOD domain-containing protein n=1 Tax=Halioxenophilus sp. WMMB6 TaxID=3073815 RepID=UPI00295F47D9|nr:HDOD domain-containing protein [Halioxenophilus sp. WMMB6]